MTGAGAAGAGAGACDGCWIEPLPELLELVDPDPDELEELDWLELVVAALAVRPLKDCSATSEITPARPMEPAIIHRLRREISRRPASRTLVGRGLMHANDPPCGQERTKQVVRNR
jgi:hypothetical protein